MYVSNANGIYERFEKGEITKERAASMLIGEIFASPRYYGLQNFSEDQRSDFLIWMHKNITGILGGYRKSKSSFLTYFTIVTRFQTKSWKRMHAKRQAMETTVDEYLQEAHAETEWTYAAEPEIPYCGAEDGQTDGAKALSGEQRRTLLVLALKSYPFLRPEHIERIPGLAGIEPEAFAKYTEAIYAATSKSVQQYQEADGKLTSSYMKCKQYKSELQMLDPAASQYRIVSKNLEAQHELLRKRRSAHAVRIRRMMPRNIAIDRALDYPPGTSSRILKNAEKRIHEIRRILDRKDP